jgi:glutathione S-transferase
MLAGQQFHRREAGAGFSTVQLDFASNQQCKPAYPAVNPEGRVPTMVTNRGTLTGTPAALAFIA